MKKILGLFAFILLITFMYGFQEKTDVAIDLSDYNPESPIKVIHEGTSLTAEWKSDSETSYIIDFDVSGSNSLIGSISIAASSNSYFTELARNIQPDFQVTEGIRDSYFDVNWPWIFFDDPFSREFKTFPSVIDLKNVKVQSTEGRVQITFSSITSGSFYGNLVCHIYSGSPLIYWEAVMTTDQRKVAYLYDTKFHTKIPKVVYEDFKTSNLDRVEPADTLTNYKVKYRTLMVDYPNGTMAIFPPPHAYFWAANKPAPNIGYLQASKESIGTRQARNLDVDFNAWVDAPAGKYQRMGVFQLLSPTDAKTTLEKVKLYTHGDQYKILDGYKTYTTHYHPAMTRKAMGKMKAYTKGKKKGEIPPFTTALEFKEVMKSLNVQIVHLGEFHCCGDWNGRDVGEERLRQLKGMFDLTQKYSDSEFTFLPGEEANAHWKGHWNYLFPKPVYFVKSRKENEPFVETIEPYGKVYRLGNSEEVYEMLKLENGIAHTSHPRIKGSKNYPDTYSQEDFFLDDDVFAAVEWKAVPSDLSQPRLGQRVFQLQDEMNQWGVKKKMIGAGDLFYLDSTSSIYSQMNINYLKLDKIPDPRNYPEVLDAIKKGDLWIGTGEVLLYSHSITETQVTADIEWTFPLEFAEVIYNDGEQIKRHTISLAETKEHGRKQFTFPVDLSNATWARFEVWDIARNGAWTQTTWLKEPVKRGLGIGSFTLINADTDYPVPGYEPIQEGAIIDLSKLPTKNLNIRIDPSPYIATKIDVEYDEDSSYNSDSSYPFSVAGEKDGQYDAWTPTLGNHKIKATPYKEDDKGRPLTLNFTIIDSGNTNNK